MTITCKSYRGKPAAKVSSAEEVFVHFFAFFPVLAALFLALRGVLEFAMTVPILSTFAKFALAGSIVSAYWHFVTGFPVLSSLFFFRFGTLHILRLE